MECSFGTDSPLDADIKGRLMEEVFSIIPVRPDDEQMFSLYHKMEAERRLTAERCVNIWTVYLFLNDSLCADLYMKQNHCEFL